MGQKINTQTYFVLDVVNYRAVIFWLVKNKDGRMGLWEKLQRLKRVQWTFLCTPTSLLLLLFLCWLGSVCLCSKTRPRHFIVKPERLEEGEWWQPSWALTVWQRWTVSGNILPTLCHRYYGTSNSPVPSWPVCPVEADGRTAGRLWRGRGSCVVFDEGDGCQLFAELLQHNHPLQQGHVVDTKGRANRKVRISPENHLRTYDPESCGSTYVMPSGSRPNNLFLTSKSLGVKSGIRWILNMRSPTT